MKLVNNLTKFAFWGLVAFAPGGFLDSASLWAGETCEVPQKNPHKVQLDAYLAQVKELMPALMDVLHDLFLHTEYWKTQKLSPLSYFLSKDPTKWIHRKREWKKIDSNLAFLATQQEHNAAFLGIFSKILQEHSLNPDYSEEKITQVRDMLNQCLSHYPDMTKKGRVSSDESLEPDYIHLIKNYKKNAKKAVAHCSQPGHFQRNWLPYCLGTAAVLGTGLFVYKNKDNLAEWMQLTKTAVNTFWQDHIVKPFLDIKNKLFLVESKNMIIKDEEAVEASGKLVEELTRNLIAEDYPEISEEEKQAIIAQIRDKGNVGFCLNGGTKVFKKTLMPLEKVFPCSVIFPIHLIKLNQQAVILVLFLLLGNILLIK